MNKEQLLVTLSDLFSVPSSISDSADLRQYIQDSIDVGELVAVLRNDYKLKLDLIDFKDVYTVQDIMKLASRTKNS